MKKSLSRPDAKITLRRSKLSSRSKSIKRARPLESIMGRTLRHNVRPLQRACALIAQSRPFFFLAFVPLLITGTTGGGGRRGSAFAVRAGADSVSAATLAVVGVAACIGGRGGPGLRGPAL